MKRIYKILIIIILAFALSLPCCGLSLQESNNNNIIAYLDETNIVNGDGASFNGNDYITVYQVVAMLCRASGYFSAYQWNVAKDEYLGKAYLNGWIGDKLYSYPNGMISGNDMCDIIIAYIDVDVNYESNQDKENWLAKQLGLVEPYLVQQDKIRRIQFAETLYTVLTQDVNMPDFEDIVVPEYYNNNESRVYVSDWLEDVPLYIQNDFVAADWKLYIGGQYFNDWFPELYGYASGLTMVADRYIIVSSDGQYHSIPHEFGHYLHIKNGLDKEFVDIYNSESKNARQYGAYYSTNIREYYAQSFSYYINGMKSYFDGTPRTYEYFDNLRKSGWIIK